jgi:streptogramin lyase
LNLHLKTILSGIACVTAVGCSSPDASELTHPPRKSSFPLYVTTPGNAAASGSLQRIDAPSGVDGRSTPVTILSGLNFPSAVAVNRDGEVYFTDRSTPTTGRIVKFLGEGLELEVIAENLQNPEGLAIDRSGKMYVSETNAGRISLVNPDKTLTEIISGLAAPRSLATDENDNLYVAETGAGTVSRVIPDGTKTELATAVVNPLTSGPGLVGKLFYLSNGSGLGDGRSVQFSETGSETYLDKLINPRSSAWEDARILYVAEGAPALRIIKYSRVTNVRTELAALESNPHSIAFTPVD